MNRKEGRHPAHHDAAGKGTQNSACTYDNHQPFGLADVVGLSQKKPELRNQDAVAGNKKIKNKGHPGPSGKKEEEEHQLEEKHGPQRTVKKYFTGIAFRQPVVKNGTYRDGQRQQKIDDRKGNGPVSA